MAQKNIEIVPNWEGGDVISHNRLNSMVNGINKTAQAVASPEQVENPVGESESEPESTAIGNEVFTAGPGDITNTTVQVTDSNGDTHDIEQITQIVLTESTSGRTMTLNISYS